MSYKLKYLYEITHISIDTILIILIDTFYFYFILTHIIALIFNICKTYADVNSVYVMR